VDADELLSRALGVGRADVRRAGAPDVDSAMADRFAEWLERRLAGEPVQYITGRAAFRSLDLRVDRHVLIPRPETEGLVEAVLVALRAEARRWPAPRVLDLGTGSGAIAVAIASEHSPARVVATDASPEALAIAAANAAEAGVTDRVEFREGHWLEPIAGDERFEVIVSNPPYIGEDERDSLPQDVVDHEPEAALFSGPEGLEALREIADGAPRHLVTGGLLALELSETRADDVRAWFEGAHDWSQVEVLDDLTGRPRVLLARREHGPAIAPLQWPEE
jgi:release factor glutamine methyltransferase